MKTVKGLLIICFVFTTIPGTAQTLNRKFVAGINFNTSKEEVIEMVVEKMRHYYETDTDGIIKRAGKGFNKNLKNKNNLESFLLKMEEDLAALLDENDDWRSFDATLKYGIAISKLLGSDLQSYGFGKANEGKASEGYAYLVFEDDYLSSISGGLSTTKDYAIHSGYNYDNTHLAEVANVLRQNFGSFTFRQYTNTWNSCSSNPETVPMIEYTINDTKEELSAVFTFEYGIYQRKLSRSECRSIGNHLTRLSFSVSRR